MRVVFRSRPAPDGRTLSSLTVGREYTVLGIECDHYRLLNDTGEPCLYPPACFDVADSAEPAFWVESFEGEPERDAYPPGWGAPGFFESWHDGDPVVRRVFAEQLADWYPGVPAPKS